MDSIQDSLNGQESLSVAAKRQADLVKEVDLRASEVDKLLYAWKSREVEMYPKKDDIEQRVEALETEWQTLNRLALSKKKELDRALNAQVCMSHNDDDVVRKFLELNLF